MLAFTANSRLDNMKFTKGEINPVYNVEMNYAMVHFSFNPKYIIVKEAKCVVMCTLYKALQDVTASH